MDSGLLQLFSPDEVLERLGQRLQSGCLHIYTYKDSANLFLKEGTLVAALNGLFEGEEVLKKVLEWKDAQYVWNPGATTKTAKPLKIVLPDYLAKRKPAEPVPMQPAVKGNFDLARTSAVKLPENGAATGKSVQMANRPTGEASTDEETDRLTPDLTITKNLTPSEVDRASREDALLRKFPLALVSVDSPEQIMRITRASNLVGRNPACAITIVHPSISRQHCVLQITERGLHVKDLETTNGTKVNGINLREGYVNVGDKLTIGHLTFKVERFTQEAG